MWELMRDHYADLSRETFEADLAGKTDVILLRGCVDGRLHGFSTLQTYRETVGDRSIAVLYSGDTVIEPEYWGQTALQRAWLAYAMRFKLTHPLVPTYWFLITKGYKTYLLLSRNFPVYWPRYDRPLPPWERAVIDALAREKFGADYRSDLGVVQHRVPAGRLREEVAPLDETLMRYPDVRFFAERNPGHVRGDELCCIGLIDSWLWISYMLKLCRRGIKRLVVRWSAGH
jgi:hypothetical protein